MASGDITSIKELGRFAITGAGHNLNGIAKNNKVMACGEIKGSYVSTGINLANEGGTRALGVSTADFISLSVKFTGTGAIVPTALNGFLANLDVNDKIFLVDQIGQDNPTVPTAGDLITIDYVVLGEDTSQPAMV